jgi:hypothetical protein
MVKSEIYKLAGDVNALSVQSYLKNTGWIKIKSRKEHIAIFIKKESNDFNEILLPLSRDFSDYNDLILNAIRLISKVENKEEIQILSDLLIAKPSDILRIRLSGEDTKEGTISFEDGFNLLENARMALYTTACDVVQPEIYHKRLSFKSASNFIEQCRLGQTERGSFIASIICPFIDESKNDEVSKQFTLFDNPNEYPSSFTRKVTTQLMKSIKLINNAIENDELDKIEKGESEIIVSANFLDSILNIKQLNKNAESIEFSSRWSSLAPVDISVPNKIEIQKDFVPAIDSIIDRMMPKRNEEVGEFVGKVSLLKAEPDASKRNEGEVVLTLIGGNQKSFNAKVILDSDKYNEACQAHKDGKNVLVKGNLVSTRKSKIIENPNFTVIPDIFTHE